MATADYGRGYGRDFEQTEAATIPRDLERLDQMDDYEVEEGDPDPRGYDVYGRNDEQIGTIDGLLASSSTMKAHFAIVDTGGWFSGKKYAIPVEDIRLRDGKAYTSYTRDRFEGAPEWNDNERDFQRHYSYWHGMASGAAADMTSAAGTVDTAATDQQVRVPVVEETADVRRQVDQTGAVTLRKRAETTTEHISTPVSRTRVSVDRRDVSAEEAQNLADADTTMLREGETLRVPVVEESVEVVKEPRVTQEVVVSAERETERLEQDVELRREVVDIDREGDLEEEEADDLLNRPRSSHGNPRV